MLRGGSSSGCWGLQVVHSSRPLIDLGILRPCQPLLRFVLLACSFVLVPLAFPLSRPPFLTFSPSPFSDFQSLSLTASGLPFLALFLFSSFGGVVFFFRRQFSEGLILAQGCFSCGFPGPALPFCVLWTGFVPFSLGFSVG